MSLDKPLESVTEADLQSLVDNKVSEGKTIDYKASLPDNAYDSKKDFLADVSSFANASGGHLIFGMQEEAGIPVSLCGLRNIDPDAEILRLDAMLREGIEPRIPGVSIHSVSQQASGAFIVVRIPHSWAQPHVVNFQRHWRFYSRNSAGKYPLDVSEVRAAFASSETIAERVRLFRSERLGKIVADETPVSLNGVARTVLHIVPFDAAARFDIASFGDNVWRLNPISARMVDDYRYNMDGLLTSKRSSQSGLAQSYLQIFRNGSIEAVDTSMLSAVRANDNVIPGSTFEARLLDALQRFLSVQEQLNVDPPVFVMLSLIGVRDCLISPDNRNDPFWRDQARPIDRDALLLPEVVVDNFKCNVAEIMKSTFDTMWNAGGWPRSLNYDANGIWQGKVAD